MITPVRRVTLGLWIVVAAAAVLLGLRVANVPLLDPDESRFARTSVEMERSGDLVVPTFQGAPRLVKPPLLHWIQSALFGAFGAGSWTARLPALGATLASLWFVAWISARRFGGESPVWSSATFATMPLVLAVGGLGTLDALLSVHVLAIVALDVVDPDGGDGQRSLAVGFLLGMCFLIKGPVGVLLPLLLVLAGRTAAGREVAPSGRTAVLAVTGGLAVVAPWAVAVLRRVGAVPLLDVLRHETLERYFAGTDHVEPSWYLLAVFAVGFFPWAGVAVVAIVRAALDRRDPATRTARYLGAATLAGLVFFSIGRSKVAPYVLPLAPLVATLVAWELGRELAAPRTRFAGRTILTVSLAIAATLLLVRAPGLDPGIAPAARLGGFVLAAGALLALAGLLRARPRLAYGAAAGAMAGLLLVALLLVLPAIARGRTSAYLIEAVPTLRDPGRPLVVLAMKVPSLAFYLDRIPEEVDVVDLGARLDRPDTPLVVADEVDLPSLDAQARDRLVEIGRQGKYVVFEDHTPAQVQLDAPPPPS